MSETHTLNSITSLLNIPMPNLPLKQAKGEIISSLRFAAIPSHISKFQSFDRSEYDHLIQYIIEEVRDDFKVTLRLIDDYGEKGGGYPIVQITSLSEYATLIIADETNKIVAARTVSGDTVWMNNFNLVHIFSRHKSLFGMLGNFDTNLAHHTATLTHIRLGGGFRIQVDNLREHDDQLYYDFSITIVYNDETPRKTALNTPDIMYTSMFFNAVYHNGKIVPLQPQYELKQVLERKDAQIFARQLIHTIFSRDGQALADLFNALLSVDPKLKRHSIEGIFTIVEGVDGRPVLYTEVIDFDGIDTMQAWVKKDMPTYPKTLRIFEQYSEGYIHVLLAEWQREKLCEDDKFKKLE